MTKFDIKNYFEKIYGLKIAKVNTRIQLGTFARHSLLIDPPNSLKSFCHLSAHKCTELTNVVANLACIYTRGAVLYIYSGTCIEVIYDCQVCSYESHFGA